MSEIDWSKAPEGFPLWLKDLNPSTTLDQSGWHRDEGDRYTDLHDRYWLKEDGGEYSVFERPSQSWSGEGLPPVGVRCEAAIPHTSGPDNERSFIWIEGSVIAYYEIKGKTYAWFAEDDGFYPPNVLELRPIRTPEQIAADEREVAISEIISIITREGAFDIDDPEVTASAIALYRAGYRKP